MAAQSWLFGKQHSCFALWELDDGVLVTLTWSTVYRQMWSTGCDNGGGYPDSTQWCPGTADTTLQEGDHWFYTPGDPIRSLAELIAVSGRFAILWSTTAGCLWTVYRLVIAD